MHRHIHTLTTCTHNYITHEQYACTYAHTYVYNHFVVNGGWSTWTPGTCSKSCGSGIKILTRGCNKPTPSCGGKDCPGSNVWYTTCKVCCPGKNKKII